MSALKTQKHERLLETLQNLAYGVQSEALTINDIGEINLSLAEELDGLLALIFEYHAYTIEDEIIEDNVIQRNLIKARSKVAQLAEIGRYLSHGETLFSFEKRMEASKAVSHDD